MDILEMARDLGKAIQQDEGYRKYVSSRAMVDSDDELQELIGEFNLKRINAQNEAGKQNGGDPELVKKYDDELQEIYNKIMDNENMKEYQKAQKELEQLLRSVNTILDLSSKGVDPDTINIGEGADDEEGFGCGGGGCAGCTGCH